MSPSLTPADAVRATRWKLGFPIAGDSDASHIWQQPLLRASPARVASALAGRFQLALHVHLGLVRIGARVLEEERLLASLTAHYCAWLRTDGAHRRHFFDLLGQSDEVLCYNKWLLRSRPLDPRLVRAWRELPLPFILGKTVLLTGGLRQALEERLQQGRLEAGDSQERIAWCDWFASWVQKDFTHSADIDECLGRVFAPLAASPNRAGRF